MKDYIDESEWASQKIDGNGRGRGVAGLDGSSTQLRMRTISAECRGENSNHYIYIVCRSSSSPLREPQVPLYRLVVESKTVDVHILLDG